MNDCEEGIQRRLTGLVASPGNRPARSPGPPIAAARPGANIFDAEATACDDWPVDSDSLDRLLKSRIRSPTPAPASGVMVKVTVTNTPEVFWTAAASVAARPDGPTACPARRARA